MVMSDSLLHGAKGVPLGQNCSLVLHRLHLRRRLSSRSSRQSIYNNSSTTACRGTLSTGTSPLLACTASLCWCHRHLGPIGRRRPIGTCIPGQSSDPHTIFSRHSRLGAVASIDQHGAVSGVELHNSSVRKRGLARGCCNHWQRSLSYARSCTLTYLREDLHGD